jgi:hypothetical protein
MINLKEIELFIAKKYLYKLQINQLTNQFINQFSIIKNIFAEF